MKQGNKYCSIQCRTDGRAALLKAKADTYRQPRQCDACAETYTPRDGDMRYCSTPCRKRVEWTKRNAQRKALTVGDVDPFRVFTRDGWRCRLCNVPTPRKLRGTYDRRAPELDHIQPLSLGGEHSYANTQLACRGCNIRKSNTPMGQLLLFCEPL